MRLRQVLAIIILLPACAGDLPTSQETQGVRSAAFQDAAARYQLRPEVLATYSYLVGRLELPPPAETVVEGGEDSHTEAPRYGLMHLTDADVTAGAALLGIDPELVRSDLGSNVMAAAALLRSYAGPGEPSWDAYKSGAARLAGLDDAMLAADFGDELVGTLGDGLDVTLDDGERVSFAGVAGLAGSGRSVELAAAAAPGPGQYPAVDWVPASSANYAAGRGGSTIKYIVIHDTEGSYWGSISWFQDAAAKASAHYVIRSSDGRITQMIREADTAWHGGNHYMNQHSIGIEHEGYMSAPGRWYTEAMVASSARLTCAIAVKYSVPVDRGHIIGHYQIPNGNQIAQDSPPGTDAQTQATPNRYGGSANHRDPGAGWPWDHYMSLVRACVAGQAPTTQQPPPPDPGQTTPPPPAPSSPTIECAGAACWPARDLSLGDNSTLVYLLQQDLVYLGNMSNADVMTGPGIFGPHTQAALLAFQRAHGVSPTGYYGTATTAAIEQALAAVPPSVPGASLSYGMSSPDVAALQTKLSAIGYAVPSTGYFGTITQSKLLAFQQARGVPGADGAYNQVTRMALAARVRRGN